MDVREVLARKDELLNQSVEIEGKLTVRYAEDEDVIFLSPPDATENIREQSIMMNSKVRDSNFIPSLPMRIWDAFYGEYIGYAKITGTLEEASAEPFAAGIERITAVSMPVEYWNEHFDRYKGLSEFEHYTIDRIIEYGSFTATTEITPGPYAYKSSTTFTLPIKRSTKANKVFDAITRSELEKCLGKNVTLSGQLSGWRTLNNLTLSVKTPDVEKDIIVVLLTGAWDLLTEKIDGHWVGRPLGYILPITLTGTLDYEDGGHFTLLDISEVIIKKTRYWND